MGPMTGRGLGQCATGNGAGRGFGNGRGFGQGRGFGPGFGRGNGRRFGGFDQGPMFETENYATSSLADEVLRLKAQLQALEERLDSDKE